MEAEEGEEGVGGVFLEGEEGFRDGGGGRGGGGGGGGVGWWEVGV